jgi:nitric oxide reductase subunit C
MAGVVVVVVGVLGLTYLGANAGASVPVIPPRPGMTVTDLAGLAVLNQNSCAACHTIDGLGGSTGPDLSRAGSKWSESHIREYILDPESSEMPPFPELTPQELDDLVTYLKSLE